MDPEWLESLRNFQMDDEEMELATAGNKFVEKECVYKGKYYRTMTEAAKDNGVSVSAVSLYVKREGCWRYEMPIVYKGVEYQNFKECAKITEQPYSSITQWVRRHRT